jgi:hypothetical protein
LDDLRDTRGYVLGEDSRVGAEGVLCSAVQNTTDGQVYPARRWYFVFVTGNYKLVVLKSGIN